MKNTLDDFFHVRTLFLQNGENTFPLKDGNEDCNQILIFDAEDILRR